MFWPAVSAEIKDQRIILFAGGAVGVLIYVLLHFGPWRNPNLNFDLFHLLGSLTFLAIASCAGSLGYSGRKKEPIPHYLIKLAVAALSTVIASALIITALVLSVHLDSSDSFLDSLYPDFMYLPHGVTYFSGAVLIYACSVLSSRLLNRPWLSALIGFAIGTTVLFLYLLFLGQAGF